jgi:ribosome biogenesis GTPase
MSGRTTRPKTKPVETTSAIVTAVHGALVRVKDADGAVHRVRSRRHIEPLACGDLVEIERVRGGGHIVELKPRRSLLVRPDRKGRTRPVAANLDRVLIVVAPAPVTPPVFLDRCLVNVECQSLECTIVFNKIDLLDEEGLATLDAREELYTRLGYSTLRVSAKSEAGLEPLHALVNGSTSLMVGVSGAGKSSITRALVPDADVVVGNLSDDGNHGRHTTSSSRLVDLPNGGYLIDSPGVRDFGTWHISAEEVALGFVEFESCSTACRFRDCHHNDEPDCAVKAAIEKGDIRKERWESYLAIRAECEAIEDGRFG